MRQAGRKSTAASQVVYLPGKRSEPPTDLSPIQAQLWREIVATKPQDWFTKDTYPILRQFVYHAATARDIQRMIEALPADADFESLKGLLDLRDRESKIMVRLATSMRLTQHSRVRHETAATLSDRAGDADKPWSE